MQRMHRFKNTFTIDEKGEIVGNNSIDFPDEENDLENDYFVEFHISLDEYSGPSRCSILSLFKKDLDEGEPREIAAIVGDYDEFPMPLLTNKLGLISHLHVRGERIVLFTRKLTHTRFLKPKEGMKLVLESTWVHCGEMKTLVENYEQRIGELERKTEILNELVDHPDSFGTKFAYEEIAKHMR
jgi:hypothetical protein